MASKKNRASMESVHLAVEELLRKDREVSVPVDMLKGELHAKVDDFFASLDNFENYNVAAPTAEGKAVTAQELERMRDEIDERLKDLRDGSGHKTVQRERVETTKIPLRDYAIQNGKDPSTARGRALRGDFQTAEKCGRDWIIDPDELWTDGRVTSGRYIGQRRKREK